MKMISALWGGAKLSQLRVFNKDQNRGRVAMLLSVVFMSVTELVSRSPHRQQYGVEPIL